MAYPGKGKKIFDHPPFPGAGPQGEIFRPPKAAEKFLPPTPPGGTPPLPSVTLPMYGHDIELFNAMTSKHLILVEEMIEE